MDLIFTQQYILCHKFSTFSFFKEITPVICWYKVVHKNYSTGPLKKSSQLRTKNATLLRKKMSCDNRKLVT